MDRSIYRVTTVIDATMTTTMIGTMMIAMSVGKDLQIEADVETEMERKSATNAAKATRKQEAKAIETTIADVRATTGIMKVEEIEIIEPIHSEEIVGWLLGNHSKMMMNMIQTRRESGKCVLGAMTQMLEFAKL